MNDRTKQFRVGVVVLATIMITSILILWNSDFSALPFRSRYQVKLLVDQAPGVSTNTPVRRRGLPIGRVDKVEDTDDGALITINVFADKQIKTNEMGRIQSSLVGDAVIEFVPTRSATGAEPVPPDAVIHGKYTPNPMDMLSTLQGDLRQTIIALGTAGEEVAELADRVNTVLGAGDMQRLTSLVESADRALAQFADLAENMNDVMGDEQFKEQLKAGLVQLPQVMSDAREILDALDGAVRSADENLKNLQGLTGPLGRPRHGDRRHARKQRPQSRAASRRGDHVHQKHQRQRGHDRPVGSRPRDVRPIAGHARPGQRHDQRRALPD